MFNAIVGLGVNPIHRCQVSCKMFAASWSYPLKPGRYSCRYLVGVIVSARFVQVRSPPPNCQPTNVVKALKKSLAPVIAKGSFRDMYGAIPDLTWNDLRKIGWRTPNTDSNSCSSVCDNVHLLLEPRRLRLLNGPIRHPQEYLLLAIARVYNLQESP